MTMLMISSLLMIIWSLDAFRAPGMDLLPRCPVTECGKALRPGEVGYLPDGTLVCADHLTGGQP